MTKKLAEAGATEVQRVEALVGFVVVDMVVDVLVGVGLLTLLTACRVSQLSTPCTASFLV